MKKLSIIILCYNEENTIEIIVNSVINLECSLEAEIIIVYDFSQDNTRYKLKSLENKISKILYYEKNIGKCDALRTEIKAVTRDFVIIQDADLEYDPDEYDKLLEPLINNRADVVFGSRFVGGESYIVLYFYHQMVNTFLTLCYNMLSNLNLTDMETCYKVFRKEIIQSIDIKENEITSKVAKILDIRIYEVGISYYGRTYKEDKKIGWKYSFRALWCILKYNLSNTRSDNICIDYIWFYNNLKYQKLQSMLQFKIVA